MSKKNTKNLFFTILPIITVGLFFLLAKSRKKHASNFQKQQIADEGYETAGDILFPPKYSTKQYKSEWN